MVSHAIVGCGRVAPAHADAFARISGVRLRYAMDPHLERARSLAGTFAIEQATASFDDLLADDDLTSISLTVPHDLHASLALRAVEAGKHVLIEKPFVLDATDGRRLIDAAAAAGVTVMPVAQHRFDPLVRTVRDLLQSGALGSIMLVRAHLECVRPLSYYVDSSWRGRLAREGGSVLINQAYHIVDLLAWLGGGLSRVSADMDARALGSFIETEDTLTCSLAFTNGALGALSVTGAAGHHWASYIELSGTAGVVAFDIDAPDRVRRLELKDAALQKAYDARFADAAAHDTEPGAALAYYGNSHRRQARAFVDALGGVLDASAPTSAEALGVVELIQAIYASARARGSRAVSVAVGVGVDSTRVDDRSTTSDGSDLDDLDNLDDEDAVTPEIWHDVRETDIEAVSQLLRAGMLSVASGGLLDSFEHDFAAFAGTKHATAFCNGTGAIHAALFAAGVRADDDVLVCDYSFHGAAAAVLRLGARIVPVDCLPDSLTMDPDDLRRAITPRAKAVLVHNPWGIPADFAALRAAARGLPLISDASHAHGALYRGQPIATWADISCFSLGVGKLITGGELGAAATDDATARDRMMIYGHINRVPEALTASDWRGNAVGLKLRPHIVALALAKAQIKRYPQKRTLMRRTCARIETALVADGLIAPRVMPDAERVYWKIVCLIDPERHTCDGTTLTTALRHMGVPVDENDYWPLLQHHTLLAWPDYRAQILRRDCPTASDVTPRTIRFPAPVVAPDGMLAPLLAAVRQGLMPFRRTLASQTVTVAGSL